MTLKYCRLVTVGMLCGGLQLDRFFSSNVVRNGFLIDRQYNLHKSYVTGTCIKISIVFILIDRAEKIESPNDHEYAAY